MCSWQETNNQSNFIIDDVRWIKTPAFFADGPQWGRALWKQYLCLIILLFWHLYNTFTVKSTLRNWKRVKYKWAHVIIRRQRFLSDFWAGSSEVTEERVKENVIQISILMCYLPTSRGSAYKRSVIPHLRQMFWEKKEQKTEQLISFTHVCIWRQSNSWCSSY